MGQLLFQFTDFSVGKETEPTRWLREEFDRLHWISHKETFSYCQIQHTSKAGKVAIDRLWGALLFRDHLRLNPAQFIRADLSQKPASQQLGPKPAVVVHVS